MIWFLAPSLPQLGPFLSPWTPDGGPCSAARPWNYQGTAGPGGQSPPRSVELPAPPTADARTGARYGIIGHKTMETRLDSKSCQSNKMKIKIIMEEQYDS